MVEITKKFLYKVCCIANEIYATLKRRFVNTKDTPFLFLKI